MGTMKINWKNMPKKVKENKLHKGELTVQHGGPVCASSGEV
jgi:hypothetical protein